MDAFTLSLAILVLFLPMAVYFMIAEQRAEVPEKQHVQLTNTAKTNVEKGGMDFTGLGVDVLQTRHMPTIHPVLRQNVAASRLMRLGKLG